MGIRFVRVKKKEIVIKLWAKNWIFDFLNFCLKIVIKIMMNINILIKKLW